MNMRERLFSGPQSHEVHLEELEIPAFNRQVSNYELLVKELHEMGFDPKTVELAVTHTHSTTIEQALTCLLKGERGWEHEFIPQEETPNLCIICQDSQESHIEYADRIENPVQMAEELKERYSTISRKFTGDPPSFQGQKCMICFEEVKEEWKHPNCSEHLMCIDCISEYIRIKIENAEVISIRCPGENCLHIISEEMIRELAFGELIEKYEKFKWRSELEKDGNIRWCITPNCEGYMKGSSLNTKLTCPICEVDICFHCGKVWHEKKSCDQVVDEAYEAWARGKEVQLCPRCKRRIEKIEGCNHMTCSVCNYEWCWLCRGEYSANHFSAMNPFGCSNLQGGENTRAEWPLWRIYFMRARSICAWIFLILLFPVIAWAYPAVELTREVYHKMRRQGCNFFLCFLVSTFAFLGIFLITPIIFVLLIPVGIVYLLSLCFRAIFRCLR